MPGVGSTFFFFDSLNAEFDKLVTILNSKKCVVYWPNR